MRSRVEGPKRPTLLDNPHQDTFQIPKYLACRNPHHCKAEIVEPRIPRRIALRAIPPIVRLPVNLDR